MRGNLKREQKEGNMKKRGKKLISLLVALGLVASMLTGCGGGASESADSSSEASAENTSEDGNMSLVVSHQPFSHGLPSYIGEKEGTFAENGLDMEILWFTGGNTQNEALGADEWGAGAYGSAPAIAAGIAYDAKIIGIHVGDNVSLGYWARPDSDIAQIQGEVEGSPDIYGNADTWRGKTILCATSTSVHFGLVATLAKLGLTQNDVNIVHMDVPAAYAAFKAGEGDIVALWDPQNYQAEQEGWVKVSSGMAFPEEFPTVFVASQKAIDENWDAVYTWFKTSIEICEKYQDDLDTQAEYLLQMQLDNGIDTDEEQAMRFVKDRPLPTLEQQIEYFSGEYGSRKMDTVMEGVIDFFVDQGSYTEEDKQTLIDNGFIDSEFIEALAEERGVPME